MEQNHPADKYDITPIELMAEARVAAEASKLVKKQVKIEYKTLKTNAVLVERHFILPETELINAHGEKINASEETVFKVLMVGRQTDEYQIKVKQGDLILSMRPPMPSSHLKATKAVTLDENGNEISLDYYGVLGLNDIIAVVDYKKL